MLEELRLRWSVLRSPSGNKMLLPGLLGNNNASFTTDADGGAGTNMYGAINLDGSGDWTQTTADGTAATAGTKT